MNRGAALLIALLVAASAVTMAAAAGAATTTTEAGSSTTTQSDVYAGTNVEFDVESDAIANYSVDGEETFSSVAVQSQREADADAGLDANTGLEAATDLNGAGLSLATQTQATAQIETESGATLSAHDTQRGTLVVESGDEAQYVEAVLAADATAEAESDDRVVVETDGREGAFLVVGEGEVTVADDGNVTADLGENATLAFRSYEDGERDETAEYEESLIAEGDAAVEVTADRRDGETVTDAVTYGQETTAEIATTAEGQVEMTVDRTTHEGTVVLTTVSEDAVGGLENLSVTVDGEAAVEASSRSELEGAIGEEPRYMVAQDAQAEGRTTVYVAIDHFSERTATIDGASVQDDGTTEGTGSGSESSSDGEPITDDETTDESTEADTGGNGDSVPGFGVGAALVALLIGTAARVRQ